MNKATVTVLMAVFTVVSAGLAIAKDKKDGKVSAAEIKVNAEIKEMPAGTREVKRESPDVKEAVAQVKPRIDEAALEEARKKKQGELKIAKDKLGKQEWVIYLTSLADRKPMGSETLQFSDGKITAKEFLTKGYLESNCTINTQEDGTVVWETMQVSENGDRIFWRGELKDNLMQGIMSMQSKAGQSQDISFTTTAPKPVEEKAVPEKDKQVKDVSKNKKVKGKE